jgi:cytochrome c2
MFLLNSIKKVFFSISLLFLVLVASPNFSQAADSTAAPAADASQATAGSPSIEKGKTLFEDNCKSCHAIKTIEVGPALKGIEQRRDRKWLQAWIKNSQKVIASGDPYATKLFAEYKGAVMTSFPSFSDEEINSILDYVKAEENKKDEVVASAGGAGNAVKTDDSSAGYVKILLAGFVIVLFLIILVLVLILSVLKKNLVGNADLTEIEADLVNQKFDIGVVVRSKGFKLIVGFLFVAFVGKAALDGVMHIGMQQGYAPKQPIAFSHKLHAGKYKIDCSYCHTGVRKGKSANIPSPNICLNCHSQIKTTSPKLEALRKAVENKRPIEWVRVHNLPDLAYFNHSQHVVVGKLECQTCHGPVEKMEVIQQYSPLTMGWCINCHRETEVKTEGNGYYDKLVRLHAEKNGTPMKVKDIGGLECSKCHY